MTMFRFGPLLAAGGAACLVAWTPEGRAPPPPDSRRGRSWLRLAFRRQAGRKPSGAGLGSIGARCAADDWIWLRFLRRRRTRAASAPPVEAALSDANLAAEFAYADVSEPAQGRVAGLKPPSAAGEEPDGVPPPQSEAPRSDAGRQGPIRLRRPRGRGARAWRAFRDRAACVHGGPGAVCASGGPRAVGACGYPGLAAASAHFSGRDPVQEGRRRGACGARRDGQ